MEWTGILKLLRRELNMSPKKRFQLFYAQKTLQLLFNKLMSASYVSVLVVDQEFRHNIVKVAVDKEAIAEWIRRLL